MNLKVLAPITVDDDGVHCGECRFLRVRIDDTYVPITTRCMCIMFEESLGEFDFGSDAEARRNTKRCDACLKGVRDG